MNDGFHQAEIARILDVDENIIHNWEKGNFKIRINYYPRIISFLGYHPFADYPNTIPDIVRIHREKLGLSIRKFAQTLAIDPETIRQYERNQTSKFSRVKNKMELEIPELRIVCKVDKYAL